MTRPMDSLKAFVARNGRGPRSEPRRGVLVVGAGKGAVPKGATVQKAVLQLYAVQYAGRPRRISVRGIRPRWVPDQATWANPGGDGRWQRPGLRGSKDVTACCDQDHPLAQRPERPFELFRQTDN